MPVRSVRCPSCHPSSDWIATAVSSSAAVTACPATRLELDSSGVNSEPWMGVEEVLEPPSSRRQPSPADCSPRPRRTAGAAA